MSEQKSLSVILNEIERSAKKDEQHLSLRIVNYSCAREGATGTADLSINVTSFPSMGIHCGDAWQRNS